MSDSLVIRGAREHNLRGVDLDLPRDRLIVFTGLSGSGKSSLAFDTIYAEGQRRYVESLSSYARQFLGQMDKPDVDFIEGLSPAISIDQKSASRNPRSTVGTITEILNYLGLLFTNIGVPHCPTHGAAITRQTPQQIVDRILELPEGTRFQVLAPVVRRPQGQLRDAAGRPGQAGATPGPASTARSSSWATRSTWPATRTTPSRSSSTGWSARTASTTGSPSRWRRRCAWPTGVAEIQIVPRDDEGEEPESMTFSQHLACPVDGESFEELATRSFSFNTPYGACPRCDGLGTRFEVDPELVVPDPDLSISEGAIHPWASGHATWFHRILEAVGDEHGIPLDVPWRTLKAAQQKKLLQGGGVGKVEVRYKNRYGRTRTYHATLRGRDPVAAAPSLRHRERQPARAVRGLHARGALPGVRRRPPQPVHRSRSRSAAATSPSCRPCRSARSPGSSRRSS